MFLNDIFDIIKFNKKSPIEQLYVIQEEEKPDIKEAEEYYRCNYRFYNSLKEMDSIENIKTEKTRIKTVLDSKNNPSIPFAIAIIAEFISIFFSLLNNNIIKDYVPGQTQNLYVIGGAACEKIGTITKEHYTMIKGNDRFDTLYKALDFIDR